MPIDKVEMIASWMEREVCARWEARGIAKNITQRNKKEIAMTAKCALEEFGNKNILKILMCFIDLHWGAHKRFSPINNMFWCWGRFVATQWPQYSKAVEEGDYALAARFVSEWRGRRQIALIKYTPVYMHTRQFYQILQVTVGLRERTCLIPWSFRVHLLAQEQRIQRTSETLYPGHTTTDAAFAETTAYIRAAYRYKNSNNKPQNILDWERALFHRTGKSNWDLRDENEPILEGVNVPFGYPWSKPEDLATTTVVSGLERVSRK